jgi:L-ribulose-5-phosphate 4-epimerase
MIRYDELKKNDMGKYDALKEEACLANRKLPSLGLVIFSFGNVSAADSRAGVFAIKPSGVAYGQLNPDQMVIVDFEGVVVEGDLRPSSDTLTHAVLYNHWPEISGIAHTHSTYATAWAQSGFDIPIFGTTHADHLTTDIPCATPLTENEIKLQYEIATGHQIIECLRKKKLSYKEVEMVLVGHHAPFTWGLSAQEAVYNSALLEEIARMALLTLHINPEAGRLPAALIQKHYERKHGPDSYYGQEQ